MIFGEQMVEAIFNGTKTRTSRRMSDKDGSTWSRKGCRLEAGDTFAIQPGRNEKAIARARVVRVYGQRLGSVGTTGALEEGFLSLHSFMRYWKALHGSYDAAETVWVVEFTLIPATGEEGV